MVVIWKGRIREKMSTSSDGKAGARTARILMFENKKYKEEDFVLPAQDTKGHSERIFYRVQPGMMRDLKHILNGKKFPFRTLGDIGRLGTKLVVDMLKTMEPIPSVSQQVDTIIRIVRDEQFHLEFVSTFEQVGQALNRYIGAGEEGQARRVLVMIRDEIKKMPKGYWRTKYWKALNEKYGHLMKNAGTGLGEGQEDEEEDDGSTDNDSK